MHNDKQQSPGQFEQFADEFTTYAASSQLSPSHNTSSKRLSSNGRVQKPKLKMVNEAQENATGIEAMFHINKKQKKHNLTNSNVIAIGDALFRSNFQSGNIQTVVKIAPATYQITLAKELNSQRVSAWFFFVVEGLKGEIKFIIKGFTKTTSLYNNGMKICFREAQQGKWRRGGTKIFYTQSYSDNEDERTTYQLQFSYFFKSNALNSVQFAYCFPYTYTNLIKFISLNKSSYKVESLGKTFDGKQIPLITIGNEESDQVIIISARCHPGQTVGSLMMQGFIKQLIEDNDYSRYLRSSLLFKIVPMINPDGVYSGNYRFSGAGYDLNRKWKSCTSKNHPQVYHFKQTIKQISKQKNILMFIDLHGHSRQKNVFFYGCTPKKPEDQNGKPNTKPRQFPFLMSKLHTAFRYDYCSYAMQKQKQGTARINLWNELNTDYIYTLQASLCGTDTANFLISDYEKIGAKLCQGICLQFWDKIKEMNRKNANKSKIKSSLGRKDDKIKTLNDEEEERISNEMKFAEQIKKNMSQFFENPDLAKVEYAGNSSDSQPQAGQIPENERQKKKEKSTISMQKYYKASKIIKFSDKTSYQIEKSPINSGLAKKQSTQLKLEPNGRKKTNESAKFYKGLELSSLNNHSEGINNISAEISNKTTTNFYVRAELLNKNMKEKIKVQANKISQSLEQNVRIISEPLPIKNQIQVVDPAKAELEKNKKKAISFQGAQYRRVRKLAQEHNRRHFSAQNSVSQKDDQTLIRGLIGMNNLLELEKSSSKNRTASFFPNNTHYVNKRKGNAELHFRRQIRASDYTSRRLYVNGLQQEVRCLGKQIV